MRPSPRPSWSLRALASGALAIAVTSTLAVAPARADAGHPGADEPDAPREPTETAVASSEEATPARRAPGPRLRYGVSLGLMGAGGEASAAPPPGTLGHEGVSPAIGAELQGRFGVQLHDVVALYYQASVAAGGELAVCFRVLPSDRPCPPTDDLLVLHASSVVLDFTFARGMQIGVGGTAVVAYFDTDHPSADVRVGYLLRVGYAFGGAGPGDRRGFTIGAQASLSFVPSGGPGPLVDIALSLGWESF